MVLTMASFPAFAEAGELSPSYLATDLTAADAQLSIGKILEATENGNSWGTYFKSTTLAKGNGTTVIGNVVVGFEDKVNLSEIYFNMGSYNMKYGKLYGSNTTTDPTSTADWTELHTFDNLSYTAKNPSVTAEGNTNTQTITHEGYYNYFKIEITGLSKDGQLVWLRSTFTGTAQESDAVALTPVGGKAAKGTGATISSTSIEKLIDGNYSTADSSDGFTQINATSFDPAAGYAAEYVFQFDKEYAFDSFSSYWSPNYMTAAEVYVSSDGITWGDPVAVVANTGTIAVNKNGAAVYRSFIGFPEDQAVGQYIKLVVTNCKKAWCRIGEVEFTGTETSTFQNKIELTGDNVIDVKNFGWVGETITDGDPALLFDGDSATTAKAFAAHGFYDDSGIIDIINGTQSNGNPWSEASFVIDLGSVYDLDYLILQGGAGNWTYTAPGEYDIYVAGVDKNFTLAKHETIVAIGGSVTNSALKTTALDATNVRYVKIQLTAASRRTALGEISVYGDEVDINTNPEAFAVTLGGQIRLPEGNVTAGLRFGATIMKDLINEGDTYGMFMLPAEKITAAGKATLVDYLETVEDFGVALDVPAARLYAEDDHSVTFTAVLVEIPAGKYSQDIVAVPYICDAEGNYTFFAEETRSYLTVATRVATAYENGEIELTTEQIALIETVIGETLVAPEVAE